MLIPSSLAKFLFSLGLMQYPERNIIVDIAAKGGPQGMIALNYLLDHSAWCYGDIDLGFGHYRSWNLNSAIAPVIHEGKKRLAIPQEVCSNPEWQSLGFATLDPSLRWDAANKLDIKKHPSAGQICNQLKASPPATEAQAKKWFELLSQQILGLYNI